MARIKSYVQDTNITDQDRILGSSYEGILNNKPIYQTKNYKVTDLAGYFSKNFDFEGVNFDLIEIKNTVDTTFNAVNNLGNSLGNLNNDGSLASISIDFANDLVAIISTVPDLFTELALSNLSAVPKAFADFLFTIADANEAFANQVLDLATSVAYATADQFNALEQLVINNTDDIDAITGSVTSLTTTVNENTGDINANALQLDIIATRVTTAETNVVALQTDIVELNTDVNTITGDIATQATQLSLIGNRVTTSEASITNLQSDFTDLSTTVDGNTGNITTNATQISSLNTVVLTANTNIAALQTDVTILETSINNISGDVTANASDISLLVTNVDTVTADVTALETDVTTLTTTVNNNTGDIATQATQVSLLANRVTTTESNILNTQTDVTSLTTTVDGNTGNISTNASNISILQTNVSTQQAQITGIITDIQQIETSVDNVTGDVEANAIAITGVGTRVTTTEAEIDNVQGNITTLTTNLNTQTGRIDTNVQNISTLSTAVTDPTTGLVALQGQITTVDNARISGDEVLTTRANLIEAKADSNLAAITAEQSARANADSANASYSFNIASSIGSVDANGNITAVSEAFANSIISTETTGTYATATQLSTLSARVSDTEADITDIETVVASKPNVYRQTSAPTGSIPIKSVWYDTDDNNKPYVYESGGWVEVRDGKVTELETYALAQKTLEADANGIITGITIKSENSGDAAPPISDITFKTNTFNIVDQSNNQKLALDASGNLTINGSGTFSGSVTITSGPTLSAITAAQTTADTAIDDASDASIAASNAQGTANTANTTANAANTTANAANTTANTALGRTVDAAGKIVFNPAPSGSGLFMNATNLGYYDGGSWKTYMQNNGNFFLSGSGGNGLSWDGSTLTVNGSGVFSGELQAGLVNINSNIITFGAADSSYSQTGKIRFNNYLGTQIGELRTSSGVAGGAPRSTIILETLGGGVGNDPVLSLSSGYGWDIGGSNMGAIYGYSVGGINKLNLFADLVLLNSGPSSSSPSGYQRIWGNFTVQWVRRTYTSGQQIPATFWPIAFTAISGAVISKGNPFLTYQTQNEAASVSYTTSSYYVDLNNSSGGTFFIIALGTIADPT